MKLAAMVLITAFSLGGCFQEKKMLPNPEDPLPSYPEYRNPQPRYDNLADTCNEGSYIRNDYF